jgi:transcriptional regulator GlxA family with amidase domain
MLSVGILVFDEVEVLDFSGPFEVFSTAARMQVRHGGDSLCRCFLIAERMRPIHTRGGMKVLPDCVLPPRGDIDILIVPGGDVSAVMRSVDVIDWLRTSDATVVASVCTGAFLLAEAGLLNGLAATTHWEDRDELQARFPKLRVEAGASWIDCDTVLTSAGISAGIDMSLHLIERIAGRDLALATARQMEYRWNPHGTIAPDTAASRLFLAA